MFLQNINEWNGIELIIVSHQDSKNKELNEDLWLQIVAPHNQEEKKLQGHLKVISNANTAECYIKKYKIFKMINLNDILLKTGNKSAA